MAETEDPLLQPHRLKYPMLHHRVTTPSHEPAGSEDGAPTDDAVAGRNTRPAVFDTVLPAKDT